MRVALSNIRIDGGTQVRAFLSHKAIEDYKDAMLAGAVFPPVDVFFDGEAYWLADGFHRYRARSAAGKLTIDCTVHEGTLRDAILFALGANANHGLRRTNADKKKIILMLLQDHEWKQWSDRALSVKANVSQVAVSKYRRCLSVVTEQPTVRMRQDGHVSNTEKVGSVKPTLENPRGPIASRTILTTLSEVVQRLQPWPEYSPVQALVEQAMRELVKIMGDGGRKGAEAFRGSISQFQRQPKAKENRGWKAS